VRIYIAKDGTSPHVVRCMRIARDWYHRGGVLITHIVNQQQRYVRLLVVSIAMDLQTQTIYPNVVVSTCKAYHGLFTKIRDVRTSSADFVIYAKRLGRILVEDALTEIPTEEICIETPCGKYDGVITPYIENNNICAVSILRAGNCLLESVLECLPGIQVGYLLIQRNEDSLDKKAGHFILSQPQWYPHSIRVQLCHGSAEPQLHGYENNLCNNGRDSRWRCQINH